MKLLLCIMILATLRFGLDQAHGQVPEDDVNVRERALSTDQVTAIQRSLVAALKVARDEAMPNVSDDLIKSIKSASPVADDDGTVRYRGYSYVKDLQSSDQVPEYLKLKAGKGQGLIGIKFVPGRTVITLIKFSYNHERKIHVYEGIFTMRRKTG